MSELESWLPNAAPVFAKSEDSFYDYCLWPYEPLQNVEGKWRSSNLLRHSFDCVGMGERIYQTCSQIQSALGVGETVWGVKWCSGRVSWEFYFYDYERLERRVSVERLVEIISPNVRCQLKANELRPYFMFSFDLDESWSDRDDVCLENIDLYLGNTGCDVSSGISYGLSSKGMAFKNLYYFFDAKKELEKVVEKVVCSAHLDLPNINLDELLWPEMLSCEVIVVANKVNNDGIYFSRVNVQQLLQGLKRLHCPQVLVSYIEANQQLLDHLLFDIGFDYTMVDGELVVLKGAYYGTF